MRPVGCVHRAIRAPWSYDPGYTDQFIELQIRQPQVFIHLPAQLLGNATAQLPIESDHE